MEKVFKWLDSRTERFGWSIIIILMALTIVVFFRKFRREELRDAEIARRYSTDLRARGEALANRGVIIKQPSGLCFFYVEQHRVGADPILFSVPCTEKES